MVIVLPSGESCIRLVVTLILSVPVPSGRLIDRVQINPLEGKLTLVTSLRLVKIPVEIVMVDFDVRCVVFVESGTRAFESAGFDHHDEGLTFGRLAESKAGFTMIEFPDTKERFFLLRHKACAKCEDCNKHRKRFQRHVILL